MKTKIKLLLAINLLFITGVSKAQTTWWHTSGQFRTGIPSGGFNGASANTGSLLFYNSSNTNTVSFQSGATSTSYTMTLPTAQGAANTVLTNNGSGTLSWSAVGTGTITGSCSSGANYVPKMSSSTAITCSQIYDNGTNVGIATTNPQNTFEIYGTNQQLGLTGSVASIAAAIPAIRFYANVSGTRTEMYSIGDYSSSDEGIAIWNKRNDAIRFATNNTEKVIITAAGNVGIGTTSPDIYGAGSDYRTLTILGPNTTVPSCGILELATQSSDATGNLAGVVDFVASANASTKKSIAQILAITDGSTSTNRGGLMTFCTKPDASTANVERMRITSAGNVGIGTTSPSEKLEVNGNIKIPAGNSYIGSDIRLKTNIDSIENSLQLVKQLQGVYFKWDTAVLNPMGLNYNTGRQIGFIAQNVQSVLPEIVATDSDSLGLLSVDYSRFTPVLVEAVKELAKYDSLQNLKTETDSLLIDSLKQGLAIANTRIDNQDSIILSLQSQINTLASLINDCCHNNGNGNGNGNGHNNLSTSGTGDYKSMQITTPTSVELNNKNIIVLDQNAPNPFAEQTTIGYYLPDNVSKAQIVFYERSGKILKTVDIKEKGKGVLNVFANDLTSGFYTYSLIVDGQVIETKKMVKE